MTTFKITSSPSEGAIQIFSIKLTDDLLEKILLQDSVDGSFISLEDNKIRFGEESFAFNRIRETNPVDLLEENEDEANRLDIVGQIKDKIRITNVLQEKNKDQMKMKTENAEKLRLARKCIVIEDKDIKKEGKSSVKGVTRKSLIGRPVANAMSSNGASEKPLSSEKPSISSEGSKVIPLKSRIIQLLALKPCTCKQLCTMVKGNVKEVEEILKEVAHLGSNLRYELKIEVYQQVKIHDWHSYTAKDKEIVLANVKAAFDKLKIPMKELHRSENDSPASSTSIKTPPFNSPSLPLTKAKKSNLDKLLTRNPITLAKKTKSNAQKAMISENKSEPDLNDHSEWTIQRRNSTSNISDIANRKIETEISLNDKTKEIVDSPLSNGGYVSNEEDISSRKRRSDSILSNSRLKKEVLPDSKRPKRLTPHEQYQQMKAEFKEKYQKYESLHAQLLAGKEDYEKLILKLEEAKGSPNEQDIKQQVESQLEKKDFQKYMQTRNLFHMLHSELKEMKSNIKRLVDIIEKRKPL